MKDYKAIFDKALKSNNYYDNIDLRFNNRVGVFLNRNELEEYLVFKESANTNERVDLDLYTFNSKKIYYTLAKEMTNQIKDYLDLISTDITQYSSLVYDRSTDELEISQIASEIEGTLKIEGVNTTRRQIMNIIKTKDTTNNNSKIILNMYNALLFINSKPEFNKDNLKRLYNILSDGCLPEKSILGDKYYRTEMVYVGDHSGCPAEEIEVAMDTLFKYVNSSKNYLFYEFLKPFIAHYYILYIHPYYDYNGRTSRMVESWIIKNNELSSAPLFISEAINDHKSKYYEFIDKTRNSHNDLTYFLIYILDLSIKYYIAYKNLDTVRKEIESSGEQIQPSILHYYKKILVSNMDWFNWKMFYNTCNLDISKQASFKILNQLLDLKLLVSKNNSSGEKIYKLNEERLVYTKI